MKRLVLIYSQLLFTLGLCAIEPDIQLTISPTGFGSDGAYLVGKPVTLSCVIENVGKVSREVFWQDHHSYHGTLSSPARMTASLWTTDGGILAKDVTQYVLWSTTFEEMPGDRILLRPGQKFIRHVRLDDIIRPWIARLAAGTYRVQLKIPEADSNGLTITLKEEPNQALATPLSVTDRASARSAPATVVADLSSEVIRR